MQLTLKIILPECPVERRTFQDVSSLVIGRSESCDLCLPLLHDVSRQHARLEYQTDRWVIIDLDSKYGTYVNDRQVQGSQQLADGDLVRLGNIVQLRIVGPKESESVFVSDPAETLQDESIATTVSDALVEALPIDSPTVAASAPQPFVALPTTDKTHAFGWHAGLAAVTFLASVAAAIWYFDYTKLQPARGYTDLGLTTGITGTILLALAGLYVGRKRMFQEWLPWRLLTWLRLHLWLSIIGLWLILIHAGFHLDGGSGTITTLLLAATVVTGIGGWYLYKKIPGQVLGTVGNLASASTQREAAHVDRAIADQLAGRDPVVATQVQRAANDSMHRGGLAANIQWAALFDMTKDRQLVDNLQRLIQRKQQLHETLAKQKRLQRTMRGWLYLHIPIALTFFGVLAFHIFDATEARWLIDTAGPHDYADPNSCYQCHQSQYDEWIGSMHAIAQSSPVTELQNRLVVFKDQHDQGSHGVEVGDLCIKCHAPTSRLGGSESEKEDVLALIPERAPASQFGVSCVACHQIESIQQSTPFAEDTNKVRYKNAENLTYTQGRTMVGPFGDVNDNDHSVGNSAHKGAFGSHFGDASFCASCHTVMVDPKGPDNLVTLQNTFKEWEDGGNKTIEVNWKDAGVRCIDCHGKPLEGLAAAADELQSRRVDLRERVIAFRTLVQSNAKSALPTDRFAATPPGDFDLPLKERRTHLHTFVGVDYHLEPNLPYPIDHPRNSENAAIQRQTVQHVADLMKIAAAVKISEVNRGSIDVDVANLATGHHLPAGFAFAREMWLEIAVSPSRSGNDDFVVVSGGNRGRPLGPTEKLDKFAEGRAGKLKNFQAVLWNGDEGDEDRDGKRHGETVLQNECIQVLKGKAARDQGFVDREQFLKPGEVRTININVDRQALANARRVRVRLRFRNYPPEFLEQLADRFILRTDRYAPAASQNYSPDSEMWDADPQRAKRTRALINSLRIFEMAEDTLAL